MYFSGSARGFICEFATMCVVSPSASNSPVLTSQFVSETNHFLPNMFQMRAHDDLVIIVHGSLVAALRIDDGNEAVVFPLHIFIAEAELAEQFDPPHFKPDEMIGVIDDAHLVGFGIADANASFIHRRLPINVYIDVDVGDDSSARPLWFALFQKRRDPFAEIGALADAGIFADGVLQSVNRVRRARVRSAGAWY
jgi:hypothetical protein